MNEDSRWLEVELVLASDTVLETRYGTLRIPLESLESLADQMNQRQPDMRAQHNPEHVVRIRNQRVFVEEKEDGGWLLKLHGEVNATDWDSWQRQLKDSGGPGGMSLGVTQLVSLPADAPGFSLVGDAADFTDDELLGLAEQLSSDVPVRVERLFQFAADPEPVRMIVVFVVGVLQAVPADVVANWLTSAMSLLRAKASAVGRRPAWDVRFRRTPDGEIDFEARYWLEDDATAAEALKSVMAMLESKEGSD